MENNKCELERKIYRSWAFSENEIEKAKINHSIYEELKTKYKILKLSILRHIEPTQEQLNNNDIVFSRKACYARGEYTVYKKPKEITDDEMALICDHGNLCFGYTKRGNNFYDVFED